MLVSLEQVLVPRVALYYYTYYSVDKAKHRARQTRGRRGATGLVFNLHDYRTSYRLHVDKWVGATRAKVPHPYARGNRVKHTSGNTGVVCIMHLFPYRSPGNLAVNLVNGRPAPSSRCQTHDYRRVALEIPAVARETLSLVSQKRRESQAHLRRTPT